MYIDSNRNNIHTMATTTNVSTAVINNVNDGQMIELLKAFVTKDSTNTNKTTCTE